MMVPTIDPIAWPPSDGAASTTTTRRPRRAASSAADTPAMPEPTTQVSAVTRRGLEDDGCRTTRAVVAGGTFIRYGKRGRESFSLIYCAAPGGWNEQLVSRTGGCANKANSVACAVRPSSVRRHHG